MADISSGLFGLAGVALGFLGLWAKEAFREHRKRKADGLYLAVVVLAHLEEFAQGCYEVACDDGTNEFGEPAGGYTQQQEIYQTTTTYPKFAPLELGVDWKTLDPDQMRSLLDIPRQQARVNNHIKNAPEDFPDYTEFFWRRQNGYANLGAHVLDLTVALRRHAGLETEPLKTGEWSLAALLNERQLRLAVEHKRTQGS